MTKRRLLPRLAFVLLPALAGCAMAMPPNNSTEEGRLYYACDLAVVEQVMDLDGVFDQIQRRERLRWDCLRAGGPVAAAVPAAAITASPPAAAETAPDAAPPISTTILPPPSPPGVGPTGRAGRQARTQEIPSAAAPAIPPPPLAR